MLQTMLFNDDWRFQGGDVPSADTLNFDDAGWRRLTLPHDWGIEGPFDSQWASATGYLPGGIGWYRKTFTLPKAFAARHVAIRFDGVYCNSEVWINGHSLGKRPNGFVSFEYDLAPYLNPNGENMLAVRVDHQKFGDARWYTGSGINRNVHLIATGPVRIAPWGIFVTTPTVTPDKAEVHAAVTVQNRTEAPTTVQATLALRDAQGVVVTQADTETAVIAPGETQVLQGILTVQSPNLWSPDKPNLYTLKTEIQQSGAEVDAEETSVGIRTIRFDADEGFFLNGENLKMKGVCLHDDAGALGTAVPVKVWERRLQTLKSAGVNAIRMAHNPHMPELYDLCDQLGFLVQDEAFDEWEGAKNKWIAGWNVGTPGKDGPSEHFSKWADTDLRDMILRDRNHPSIVMWSIGNEIDYPNDPYTHEVLETGINPQSYGRGFRPDLPHANRLGEIARHLVAVAKSYDQTRPITAALSAALIGNEVGLADALDVVGYNYQEYRYPDDHARYPDRVLYGSENGMRWEFWQAVADNPYISGQFLWTGIDYLGEAHGWPTRSNGAGLMDLAGFPKPEYFYRQSLWANAPMVWIGTRDVPQGKEEQTLWTHKKADPVWHGTPGTPVRVICFTNCDEAELFLNSRSLGIKSRSEARGGVLSWDVPYAPGTLSVQGRNGGMEAATAALQTSGPAARLLAETDTKTLTADGVDLAHISVTVTDANDVPVHDAAPEVTWSLDGPAHLIGLESGDPTSHEDYKGTRRKTYRGRLLGYVQATKTPGDITLRLTAPGLEDAIVTLRTELQK